MTKSIDTPEQGAAPTGAADSFPDLADLAAIVSQAVADAAAFGNACRLTDSVAAKGEGRDITDADEAVWERTEKARSASIAALLAHRPSSAPEMAAKAAALCSEPLAHEVNEADWPRVYLADALHLAALAGAAK